MKSPHKLRSKILVADLGWLVISLLLAWLLRYGRAWDLQSHATVQMFRVTLLGSLLLWPILWSVLALDRFRGGWRFPAIVSQLVLTVSLVMATLLTAGYMLRIYVSRLVLGYFAVLLLAGLILIRAYARAVLRAKYRNGDVRRVIIVGSGPVAMEAAAKIEHHPEMLCKVVGFLSGGDSLEILPTSASNSTALRSCAIMDLLRERRIDELIFDVSRNTRPEIAVLMDQCVKQGVAVSIIPQPYELYLSTPELTDLDGLPILRLRNSVWSATEPAWKRALDIAFTIPLLLPSLPLIMAGALVLKIKKGKAFCSEDRCGKGGATFRMYRLNSPRHAANLPTYELMMQHLSVTELPQLFNVVRGDMSLVGPRPEGLASVRHYTDWHLKRLSVKPGMTGLAQVHGLREQTPLEDKTRYDLQYILRRSLFQDVSLLLQTISTLFLRLGHVPEPESSAVRPPAQSTSSLPV